ncbi:hypothetical protein AKJ09_11474 [Labilithrix luteola]|uniref:Uncharacterized protein n=1 Tax=Labilithrix luteola TaxID=1391654 RepID=A0A0K1QGB9_9BACT|nr:hypothetical protein AKJ09_11474 [Labilithrix luteola]
MALVGALTAATLRRRLARRDARSRDSSDSKDALFRDVA